MPAQPRHFPKWESIPIPWCGSSSELGECLLTGFAFELQPASFHFIWEQQSGWTIGMIQRNNTDGVCPGDTLLEVEKFKTLVLSTWVNCAAHFVPWVYSPPWRQTHYSLLRETGKISPQTVPGYSPLCEQWWPSCPSNWSRVLPSPLLLVI